MPIRRIFQPVWRIREQTHAVAHEPGKDGSRRVLLRHELEVEDRAWALLYAPIPRCIHWSARQVARLQTGRIRRYLTHSFVTLLVLLWVVT
jgi:hypothetical protein